MSYSKCLTNINQIKYHSESAKRRCVWVEAVTREENAMTMGFVCTGHSQRGTTEFTLNKQQNNIGDH